MTSAVQKIRLSASRDIPFNKLVLSQSNVRRVKAGISIEDLAEDIARRTLLQGLSVRPVLDADSHETGMFEVPAGGRRFRALELLVKQKRLAKTAPIPCVVREDGWAEEDSLAENIQRVALHPLDQFRAFQALRDKGLSEEDIAARFFVSGAIVKQRLRLAAVSDKLLSIYAEDGMTLDQLMAFTVTSDHARQDQVWEGLSQSHNTEPYYIRRQLTAGAVQASDRRAQFVGMETYEAAGGIVMRDLFQHDDGGWLQDPGLLDRLVTEKLQVEADALRAEGWKWIVAAADLPYGHTAGLRRLPGKTADLTDDEQANLAALRADYAAIEQQYAEADELPDDVDHRLGEIETAIAAFDDRPVIFDPQDVVRAGVFVSVDGRGKLKIERGFVRPEDEAPVAAEPTKRDAEIPIVASSDPDVTRTVIHVGGTPAPGAETPDEDDAIRPLSERLVMELAAHSTLALRDAVANKPNIAFQAVLHALCLSAFYASAADTCLEIVAKSSGFSAQAPGLKESASAKAIDARHESWARQLPKTVGELWDVLTGFDGDSQAALFAHCASLTVNVVKEPWSRRDAALDHGNKLAQAVDLDMAAAGWRPTIDNYLGRVPKARILEAVREAKGDASAQLIDHLKKPDMAREAERLLDGTGWLPEPLRMTEARTSAEEPTGEVEALPAFLGDDEDGDASGADPEQPQPHAVAAE
ncbi:ParB/RepB/Spo0J family partition protein [Blastochloris sulfoviridis]|uniref:DNA-binding protein n=1 Tax=Blastochloris sulfoviridis TaxID=50712 RepID=A0A5M6I0P0_9HYPH|nr:ParB/RepB/Spo0J family partition protein [Blastochloris sulfoviridis]KAA5601750.1 DNA-binding protein [Blastochloris sulfoviridis]